MSGSATIGLEQAVLGHTLAFAPMAFPAQVFVALCAVTPPSSEVVPGVELSGGGYTRMPAIFALTAAHANVAANVATIEYPLATTAWGTAGYFELWDAATGGNRLYWGRLTDPATGLQEALTIGAGDIPRFSASTLVVQAAAGAGTTASVGAYLPLAGGTLTGALVLAADPVAGTPGALQAATRQYVDAHSGSGGGSGFLPISGGTLTGALTLVGDAAAASQPVTLRQLNAQASNNSTTYLPLSGGTVSGELNANYFRATSSGSDTVQGAYLMWNRAGDGLTDFVNNRGLGSGGFVFIDTDGTTDVTLLTLTRSGITSTQPITFPSGNITSGGLSVAGTFSSTGGAAFSGGNVTFQASPLGLYVINRMQAGAFSMSAIPASFANDAAAATGGVPIGGFYRNGSALQMRVS